MINKLIKLKDAMLNATLVILVILMIVLMYLNWTKSLSVHNMPQNFFAYKQVISLFEKTSVNQLEIQTQQLITPSKIGIRKNGELSVLMYDDTRISSVYSVLFSEIDEIDNDSILIEKVNYNVFYDATNQSDYVYMELLCPLSAVINIEIDIFVTDMIARNYGSNVELYIRSNDSYYKMIISKAKINFEITEQLTRDYEMIMTNNGAINLVSNSSMSAPKIDIKRPFVNLDIQKQIISSFLYNPAVVTSYQSNSTDRIYVNEYSTITISNDYVQFESKDPRGNIFLEQRAISRTDMQAFAISIFDEVYVSIDSKVIAHPTELYKDDGQTVVVLSGRVNGIDIEVGEPFAVFIFSSSGLSYCKINLKSVIQTEEKVSLMKTNLFKNEHKFVLGYDVQGEAQWKYYFDGE